MPENAPLSEIDEEPITDLAPALDTAYAVPIARQPSPICQCMGGTAPCRRYPEAATNPDGQSGADCEICAERITWGRYCRTREIRHAPQTCAECVGVFDFCPECRHRRRAETDPVCSCIAPPSPVIGYHGSRSTTARQAAARLFNDGLTTHWDDDPIVGFEIECAPADSSDDDDDDDDAARTRRWHRDPVGALRAACGSLIAGIEGDASLPAGGFEVVTEPMPLSVWREHLGGLYAAIVAVGMNPAHSSCGAHVHFEASRWVKDGARAIAASYGVASQQQIWAAVSGRPLGSYCTPLRASVSDRPGGVGALPDRRHDGGHAAICLGSTGCTVEWRQPAGTRDARIALARAELFADVLRHAYLRTRGPSTDPDDAGAGPALPLDRWPAWGWGAYLTDRAGSTDSRTVYARALLRALGY